MNAGTLSRSAAVALFGVAIAISLSAQVKSIPAEGIEGLSQEDVSFEPEYRQRMKTNAGQFAPAAEGTKPGSADPQNMEGIWIAGTQSGSRGGGAGGAAGPAGAGGTAGAGSARGGAPGGNNQPSFGSAAASTNSVRAAASGLCRPGSVFVLGTPSKIVQTKDAIYILKVASMSQNGTSYRRIAMTDKHPENLALSYGGDAIGHWEGDTLVVETVALKGGTNAGPPGAARGGAASQYTATTKATERIKKIEGGLKLQDDVTIVDTATGAQLSQMTLVGYYRPDLKFIEAPCEEYADPLETELSGPFAGGDEGRGGGAGRAGGAPGTVGGAPPGQ